MSMGFVGSDTTRWSASGLYVWLIPRRGQWIRRRSDTIDFLDSTTVRIRTELTIALDEFIERLSPEETEIKLPLLLRKRGVASTSTIYDESGAIIARMNRLEEVRALKQGLGYASAKPTIKEITKQLNENAISSGPLAEHPPDEHDRKEFAKLIKNNYFISAKLPKTGPTTRVLIIERFAPIGDNGKVFITGGKLKKPTIRDRCLPWSNKHVRGLAVTILIEDWASSSSYHLSVNAPRGCIVAPLYPCNTSGANAKHPEKTDTENPRLIAEIGSSSYASGNCYEIRKRQLGKSTSQDTKSTDLTAGTKKNKARNKPLKLDAGNTVPFSVRLSATIPETRKLPLNLAYSVKRTNFVRAIVEPVHHGTTRMLFGIIIVLGIVSLVYEVTGILSVITKSSSVTLSSGIVILALLAMGAPLLITPQNDVLAERLMFFSKAMFVLQGAWTVLFILYVNLVAAHVAHVFFWNRAIPGCFSAVAVLIGMLTGSHYWRLKRFAEVTSLSDSRAKGAEKSHFYAKSIVVDPSVGARKARSNGTNVDSEISIRGA